MFGEKQFQSLIRRVSASPMLWSWAFYGLKVGSAIALLPLILRVLSKEDLGVYYVFFRIVALVPIIDFGFSATVGRFVSYAMGGAAELKAYGVVPTQGLPPNRQLLWRLLRTYRRFYHWLSLAALVLLGVWGTFNVTFNVQQTSSPARTWVAWGVTLIAATWEIYAGWWNVFLRGMNEVVLSARFAVLGYLVQILIAVGLLVGGGGLLSVPVASLAGSLLQRFLSRKACLRLLSTPPELPREDDSILKTLWPTTWRTGLQFLSTYMGNSLPALIFAKYSLAAFAEYSLSLQIVTFCSGMAAVWTLVKWPIVGQYQAQRDYGNLRRILRPASWMQSLSYILLAGGAIAMVPWLLALIKSHKQLVPAFWLILLAVSGFFEMRFSFWTTLLSTENRIPSLWPTVATNIVAFLLFLYLLHFTQLGVGTLILPPLLAGAIFNYWYWAFAATHRLRTTWLHFSFARRA